MWDNLRADTRRLRDLKSKPAAWYVLESLLFEVTTTDPAPMRAFSERLHCS